MNRSVFDPGFEQLPRVLPVFPLPGALLLPGARLPLNIFEPRYLAMVRDALSGERLIGMVQPREPAYDAGAAPIYCTGCAGRITAFGETDDGRYLITLSGLIRFDVVRELPPIAGGYRRAVVEYGRYRRDLEEDTAAIDRARLLRALAPYLEGAGVETNWEAIEEAGDEMLVNTLAMLCPFDAREKQALLEALTLEERVATMTAILEMSAHAAEIDGPLH